MRKSIKGIYLLTIFSLIVFLTYCSNEPDPTTTTSSGDTTTTTTTIPNDPPTIDNIAYSRSIISNYGGDNINIEVTASDSDGTIFAVYFNGESLGLGTVNLVDNGTGADVTSDDGVYSGNISNVSVNPGDYEVIISARDNSLAYTYQTNTITVDGTLLPVFGNITLPTMITNDGSSFELTVEATDDGSIASITVNAASIGLGDVSLSLDSANTYTNTFTPVSGLGSKALVITAVDDLGAVNQTNVSITLASVAKVYFLDGYGYSSPYMWFWQTAGSEKDIASSGTTNIGGFTFDVFETIVSATGSYYYKFKDGTGGGAVWEELGVDSAANRANNFGSSDEAFAMSWNRKNFTTFISMSNIIETCAYNLTNMFAGDYVLPGCSLVDAGSAYLFSVFNPNAKKAQLMGTITDWDSGVAPEFKFDYTSGYWWIKRTSGVSEGGMYKFLFDSDNWIADPYGRSFNDGDNDNTLVVSTDYTWGDGAWTRPAKSELVIYEMNVKDFTRDDTSVTASLRGTYSGMIEKITYYTDLGINAVEIMPVQEWSGAWYSWGYNNCGYFAPENSLSTNADNGAAYRDMKELVDELHQNGIAVIFDVVYNHTANDNNYLWAIDNDYYFDPAGTPWGNKVEMRHLMSQKFFMDNLKFWMDEFHIDGFRLDATEEIDMGALTNMFTQLIDNGYSDRYFIFEEFNGTHNGIIQSFNTGEGDGLISSWGTSYKNTVWEAVNNGSSGDLGKITYYSKDDGWNFPNEPLNYFSSHDEGTLAGGQSATKQEVKTAAVHLLTSMGIPMIWMGDEFMRLHYGNNPPSGDGIDEANNMIDWTLLTTNDDLFDFYAALIRLRINHDALRNTVQNPDGSVPDHFDWNTDWSGGLIGYAYKNYTGDNDFVVLVNYGASSKAYNTTFPSTGTWYQMCDGVSASDTAPGLATFTLGGATTNITIPAKTAYIYMSDAVN